MIDYVIALAIGFVIGAASYRLQIFPWPQLYRLKRRVVDKYEPAHQGFRPVAKADAVPVPHADLVFLIIGQSNAANTGESLGNQNLQRSFDLSLVDGRVKHLADPMLNATGKSGSVWSRFAVLAESHLQGATLLFCNVAVNGSSIRKWTPDGELHQRIRIAIDGLRASGNEPTHILWQQGEKDAEDGMSEQLYSECLQRVVRALRAMGTAAPIFVSQSSICCNRGSEAIRAAQRAAVIVLDGVLPGPDTDSLDRMRHRTDGCHFSDEGLNACAHLWFKALEAHIQRPFAK